MFANHWLLWISLFCVSLFVVLALSKIELKFIIRRKSEDDEMKVYVRALYGLVKFSVKMPAIKLNAKGIGFHLKKPNGSDSRHMVEVDDALSNYELILEMLDVIKEFRQWFRMLLSKVELSNWRWQTLAGTGDAMTTAISCGTLWSVKGLILGRLSSYMKIMNAPEVVIQPQFQQKIFITEWSCLMRLKLGSLFIAGIYLLLHFTQFRESLRLWKTLVSRV